MQSGKLWLFPFVAALLGSLALAAPDFSQYGYPNVVTSLTLNPYDYVRLGIGGAVLTIPQGAFGQDPVRLELLRGDSTAWQTQAPSGQKVIYAFALRVTDLKTNQAVLNFSQPLTFSFYSAQLTEHAGFWDTSPANPAAVSPDPVMPALRMYRIGSNFSTGILSHPISGAETGWLITVPLA